jgi:hypothetical protein
MTEIFHIDAKLDNVQNVAEFRLASFLLPLIGLITLVLEIIPSRAGA